MIGIQAESQAFAIRTSERNNGAQSRRYAPTELLIDLTHIRFPGAVALKLAQDDHGDKERNLREDKRGLKVDLKENELGHMEVVKTLKRVSRLRWIE